MRMTLAVIGLLAATPALAQPQAPSPDMYSPPAAGWSSPPGSAAPAPGGGAYGAAPAAQPGGYGAQPGSQPRMNMRQRFDAANITHDGRLTLQQAQAAHLSRVVHNFGSIDRDHKGYVTMQDLREWHRSRRASSAGAPPSGAPSDGPPE